MDSLELFLLEEKAVSRYDDAVSRGRLLDGSFRDRSCGEEMGAGTMNLKL